MKKQVKVVVVDDNEAVIRSVKDYFKDSEIISVIGGFTNGKDALNYLLQYPDQYDLLMLDLILTQFDGIRIIEELKNHNINKKIMVLSSFKDDFTIRRVQALGASYFMLKPVDMEIVNSRIMDLVTHKDEMQFVKANKIEVEVSTLLHDLGIPSHVRGYEYIREGVLLLFANDGVASLVTKEIYPKIANKYQTTSSRVERAIRHAIEVAWGRGQVEAINKLFGYTVHNEKGKPTNSEFIAIIADKLRLKNKVS